MCQRLSLNTLIKVIAILLQNLLEKEISKGSSQEKRGPLVANNTQDLHSATIEPLNAFLMAGTGIRRRNNVFDTPFVGLLQLV